MSGDYIRREAAISALRLVAVRETSTNFYAAMLAELKGLPATDVVEVVRCADCKYDERCMFQSFVQDERVEPYDKTVFFCADGKRKDGGHGDGD